MEFCNSRLLNFKEKTINQAGILSILSIKIELWFSHPERVELLLFQLKIQSA